MSYTGAVAVIDPSSQTVCHIYDSDLTTPDEVGTLDILVTEEILRLIDGMKRGEKPKF